MEQLSRAFWRTFGGGSTFWCTFDRFFFRSFFAKTTKIKRNKSEKKRPKSATFLPGPGKNWIKQRPKVRLLTRRQKSPVSSANPTRPLQTTLCVACAFFGRFFLVFFAFLVALCFAGAFLVCFLLLFQVS